MPLFWNDADILMKSEEVLAWVAENLRNIEEPDKALIKHVLDPLAQAYLGLEKLKSNLAERESKRGEVEN